MINSVLITGGNGGIGGMILNHLLGKGHKNVFCQYRNGNQNLIEAFTANDMNPEDHIVQANLSNESEVKRMGKFLRDKTEFIGSVINVAGASKNGMSWKTSKEDFMSVIDDNLLSAFLCSKEFIPDMRERQFGRIINFSSIVGSTGIAGAASYCAAKAGLIGLTKAMSKELATKNITVNAVALGYFEAGLIDSVPEELKAEIKKSIPMQRFGTQKDIGSLIEYMISNDANYYTGQVVHLNGGQI